MALQFGTSGVRGLVTEFTPEEVEKYVHAFVKLVRRKSTSHFANKILVAGDLRPSTPAIQSYIISALQKLSIQAIDLGKVPTPALAWACKQKSLPGIMITGSHIPSDRNGLKFYFTEGEILKSDEAEIIQGLELIPNGNSTSPGVISENGEQTFVQRYTQVFSANLLHGLKVVLYEHSSVAASALHKILVSLGATVISYGKSAEFIAVDTEALSMLAILSEVVRSNQADVLVSTDGDGDRPLVLDEHGNLIKGDVLGLISALTLNAKYIVTPVTSTTAIEKCPNFKQVIRTKVGSPFVVSAMENISKTGDLVLGFEANGGLLLGSDWTHNNSILKSLPTRDSVLPILLTLMQMKQKNQTLSQIIEQLPARFGGSDLVRPVPLEKSNAILQELAQKNALFFSDMTHLELGEIRDKNQLDGLRFTFADDSVLHFRPSGNAPEFRIYTEAADKPRAIALLERAKTWIQNR